MLIHPGEIYIRIIKLDLCNAIAQTDTAHLCYLINHILHCSGKTLKCVSVAQVLAAIHNIAWGNQHPYCGKTQ